MLVIGLMKQTAMNNTRLKDKNYKTSTLNKNLRRNKN